jgi:hypothetical protein
MHQVFISYNNADRRLVDESSQSLEGAGYSTWFYDRDRRIGLSYVEYGGALATDCQAMVRLISRESFVRLRSAGVKAGDSAEEARMCCGLYADYLKRQVL